MIKVFKTANPSFECISEVCRKLNVSIFATKDLPWKETSFISS